MKGKSTLNNEAANCVSSWWVCVCVRMKGKTNNNNKNRAECSFQKNIMCRGKYTCKRKMTGNSESNRENLLCFSLLPSSCVIFFFIINISLDINKNTRTANSFVYCIEQIANVFELFRCDLDGFCSFVAVKKFALSVELWCASISKIAIGYYY